MLSSINSDIINRDYRDKVITKQYDGGQLSEDLIAKPAELAFFMEVELP